MIELKGKYNKNCKIFIDDVEGEAISMIQSILDQPVSNDVQVRIMPDVHAGKGIVIGFTMPLTNMVNPNFVGVDIGCGMLSSKFTNKHDLNLSEIDIDIKNSVPMGFRTHEESVFKFIPFDDVQKTADRFIAQYNTKFGTSYETPIYNEKWLSGLLKRIDMDVGKFYNAIGTLGGGELIATVSVNS